jgi:uncharacterized protein with ParB-like and HNH nuclease domain
VRKFSGWLTWHDRFSEKHFNFGKKKMDTQSRKLIDLFEARQRYVVPIFQRHYVWDKEEEWIPLWEDIVEKLTQRLSDKEINSHFLGVVILDSVRRKATMEVSRFLIIDGQQRLMTMQLLLKALRDYATTHGIGKLSSAVQRALFNPDPDLMENSSEEIYKLWPTQLNRKVYCDIINANGYEDIDKVLYPEQKKPRKKKPEARDRLVEAYVFFYSKIRELCANLCQDYSEEDILLKLYSVLRNDFTIVEIILGEQDDSQEIFHSLNAHRKQLSQSDLLRSFVFMRAEKNPEIRDYLYEKYWKRFEEWFWDFESRRGNLRLSRLDQVTRIFLSSNIGAVVEAKRIHLVYKNWIQTKKPFQNNVEAELKAFSGYGDRFRFLVEPTGDSPFSEFARRLQIWDVSTAYPLVIYLYEEGNPGERELFESFNTLESFVVRRLICGKDNKEYNKYFVELIDRLRREGSSHSSLRTALAEGKGITRIWPDDKDFERYFFSRPIYNILRSSQIATLINNQMLTSKTENVTIQSVPTIEHIMPKEWYEHYELDGEIVSREIINDWSLDNEEEEAKWEKAQSRNQKIHCIGNLTIVNHSLNAAMRNAAFEDKKIDLRNSVLIMNRYFDTIDKWDEKEIDQRARSLFDIARHIWTGPPMA